MMKTIKRIGGLVAIFLLTIYNTCFADVIMPGQSPKGHGMQYRPEPEPETTVNYVIIGILVLVVIVCAVIIIRRIMKKKKEKEHDNNNNK